MSLLPENKLKDKNITPKVFFIWGQSMHGKTYLAKHFPEPLILNTDGNGQKIDTPHIDITDFEMFVNVLKELEEGNHTFKTIVIDIVDDIKTFLEDYVCKKYGVENLGDVGYGKAYNDVKNTWKRLMIRLSHLSLNVVFISHIVSYTDEYNDTPIELPSLEQKYLNMTKGRTDVMIKCQKVGKSYLQICTEKRDYYTKEDFKDPELLEALKDVKYLFEITDKPEVKEVSTDGLIKKVVAEKKETAKPKETEKKTLELKKETKIVEKTPLDPAPIKEAGSSLLIKKKEV